jgi:uncharacterized membrane protein
MSEAETTSPQQAMESTSSGSGLPENVAAALAYVLGPITGIAFFILDRSRSFVRYHAVQCIAISIVGVAFSVAFALLGMVLAFIPIIGWLVGTLLSLALGLGGFVLWVWLILQAYRGKQPRIPGLAPHVTRIAAETG